ncbi:protein transport protein Sec16B isoform X2 [Pseudophryne corroboree]|uniref:protein transport protein Sec16B isoform X2 n=1 Tax=Pseudophryne corroboree TaxID=495146 RepID=UPI003081BEE6
MDHGAPPGHNQSQTRPAAGMGLWRGMYAQPLPHQYRNNSNGSYQQYHMQGGHQAWPDQWVDYYSQYPAMHIDHRRPVSRAEMYERSEQYRPLSRQEYDERYGFYDAVYKESCGNRGYNDESPAGTPGERDWRRGTHNKQIGHWSQSSSNLYSPKNSSGRVWPQSNAQSWSLGFGDNGGWHHDQRRCGSAMDTLEQSFGNRKPSLLSEYRDSGMSSSSFELSQYMHDPADLTDPWNPLQNETLERTPQPTAPMKFSLPHVTVCFGARGQLVRVCPNFPDEGQPALVEIHSIEVLLHDTVEQEELRQFPGPVQREDLHKVDVMSYCQQNVSQCLCTQGPRSRDDALLWQVLLQMCRQNGHIVGTDVAELLLQDCKREKYQKEQQYSDLIYPSEEPHLMPDGAQVDLLTGESPFTSDTATRAMEKFTRLLFFGRKKEALDWAMKNHLWGHALFLSSKMDSRTYSGVMARFTSTLAVNDPLQTLFQLMAGRTPQASTCSGDTKWGDWRPHLAVMLSNQMTDPEMNQRAIVTMGDHLVLKGFIEAGHCCFLTAGISLGQFCKKSDRLVLLGSNPGQTFKKFACTANIQRSEILEYCQSLGKSNYCIPSFQMYKFVYATRLLDYGLTSVALHYCECIASAILHSDYGSFGSFVLISELIKLAERLKYSDPQLLERPELEQNQEPVWLVQLRSLFLQVQAGYEVGTSSHVACDNQQNQTEATREVSTLVENQQAYQEYDTGCTPYNAEAEAGQNSSWVVQSTNLPPIESQNEICSEWGAPKAELPFVYNTYEKPHEQENIDDFSETPSLSSSLGDNALMMQAAFMSRRVSAVSQTSTVSMEDDDREDRSRDEAPPGKSDLKKGSTFGWFNWFRSKPAKEAETPVSDPQIPAESSSQTEPPQRPSDKFGPPLLPPSGSLPPETSHSFFRGITETEDLPKINNSSVLPKIQGQQENMGVYPNVSVSQMTPPAGAIPLYNPSQFFQETGRSISKPSHLARGRYPLQPR